MVWCRTEVDGVPAYWAKNDDDQRRVFLAFRVGVADEQLAWRGITHLVEHLAMHAVGGSVHDSNGQVDAVTTMFGTQGGDTEIADFVTGVCRALRALPFKRLELENQVLRTEADTRGTALTSPLMAWRYGAATYGLPAYEEFGVGRHTPDRIAAWADRWFTRRNLVLVFAGGPPPAGRLSPVQALSRARSILSAPIARGHLDGSCAVDRRYPLRSRVSVDRAG